MLRPAHTGTFGSARLWNRLRVQAGGALLFGALLPTLALAGFYPNFLQTTSTILTGIAIVLASVLSVLLLRNLTIYPGIRGGLFVFPAVATCFGATFLIFLLLRLDYSRAMMISAASATLIWLYLANLMIERGPALLVGVAPFGQVRGLAEVRSLKLHWLEQPRITSHRFDMLVADFRADLSDEWEVFLTDCALAGMPVLHVKQLQEALTGRVEIEHLSENSFGSLIPFVGYLKIRRVVDFVAALVVGTLLLPLFLIIAILIKLDSRGPVLFRQVRIGYRGHPFRVAKFRTMVTHEEDGDARNRAMTKSDDDRVTRLGRFLRRSRIDELPQILNILKLEMSWIGPRPEAEPLSKWYEAELPHYRYRHIVPPGITGWAQVNQGHVSDLKQVTSKLHYDFYYIKNFSPWLDALIVAKTVQTMLTGFGAK